MVKNSGGTRNKRRSSEHRTGPGFTEPIKGPTQPLHQQLKSNTYLQIK